VPNGWSACKYDSDCLLIRDDCCSPCASDSANSLIPINAAQREAAKTAGACSGAKACAACPSIPEGDRMLKYFRAVCAEGHCSALDVRASPLSECGVDADCYIHAGTACCDPCDDQNFVALNKHASLCDDPMLGCDACVSTPPDSLSAACVSGHCLLR
jgi:hypothetical protein